MLVPKADRRKDWEDKAMIGHFIGYSKTKKGYQIMLHDTVVTSVHVLFDESIPERSVEYFQELDAATVKLDPNERSVSDFDWLVGQYHMEDGLLFKTTRVVVRRGLIVGFRSLITNGKTMIEDKVPIHIADVQLMTEELARRLHVKSGTGDDRTSEAYSTVVKDVTPRTLGPELPSKERGSLPSVVPEPVPGPPGKRVRTKRSPTNIAVLGEINLVEVEESLSLLGDIDSVFYTNRVNYREPETYQQSLDCPDEAQWINARAAERNVLLKRRVLEVIEGH